MAIYRAAAGLVGQPRPRVRGAALAAAVTGALWLAAAGATAGPAAAAYACALVALAVLVSVTDIASRIIPNVALAAAAGLWLPLWLLARPGPLTGALLGAALFAGPLGIAACLNPNGMGLGDVKLAAVLGLYLGLPLALLGLVLGTLAGGFGGLAALLRPAGGRRATIPYGPFLAAGAVAAMLWGAPLLRLAGWG